MKKEEPKTFTEKVKTADIGSVLGLLNTINPLWSEQETVENRRKVIKSFKAKANAKRSFAEKFADGMTSKFGSVTFLLLNAIWFATWISINVGWIPWIEPFDPFPFGLLTMVVSLEAIFLAIIVLISQNREARIGELREEIDLQINTVTEREITKLIQLVLLSLKKQGIKVDDDAELQRMLKPMNNTAMEQQIERELGK